MKMGLVTLTHERLVILVSARFQVLVFLSDLYELCNLRAFFKADIFSVVQLVIFLMANHIVCYCFFSFLQD